MTELIQQGLTALLAGFVGTLVMTLAQWVEMIATKRTSSTTPAQAFCKIFKIDFEKLSEKAKTRLTYAIHFLYGTVWGLLLVALSLLNIENMMTVLLIYFLVIWLQGLVVYKAFDIAPWFWTWGLAANFKEVFFKIVLAASTVGAYIYLKGMMGIV